MSGKRQPVSKPPASANKPSPVAVASKSSTIFTFRNLAIFPVIIILLGLLGGALIPKFPGYLLFTFDHLAGRVGLRGPNYHCVNNRFDHATDFSQLVAEGRPGRVLQPPTIAWKDYTPEKLKKLSNNYRLPVVVQGMFTSSQAGQKWSAEYFDRKFGNQSIIYMDCAYPITSYSSAYQRQNSPTTMHDYVQNISGGGKRILGNDHYLMLDYPELIEELELNRWGLFDGMPILPLSLRFFMGANDTGVGWHAATSHNLFVEVKGKKLFKWFPPQLTWMADLHPTLSQKLPAIEHCAGHYYDPEMVTYEYVLDDGDAAFTPAWVWHATRHLEHTVAVGLRMESFMHDARSFPLQTFLSEFSTDLPGFPFFNAFTRGIFQTFGVRIQGQALSRHEKENGYKWDWLRDYMQAGGKLTSESDRNAQWKL